MVIVLIHTQMQPDSDRAAYDKLNARMFEIVQSMPGFIGASGYASPNGEDIGMIRFESLEALRAWRDHPEHLVAQQRGKSEFYASYRIEVCEVVRGSVRNSLRLGHSSVRHSISEVNTLFYPTCEDSPNVAFWGRLVSFRIARKSLTS